MESVELRYKKAAQLSNTLHTGKAEQALRDILADDPGYLPARATLIAVLEKRGQLEEVERLIEALTEDEKKDHQIILAIANYRLRQKDYNGALEILSDYDENQNEQAQKFAERRYFMEARCYDACGRYDEAFRKARAANDAVRAIYKVKEADMQRTIHEITQHKQLLSRPGWLESWSLPVKYYGVPPVFIMGFPRSGTTLTDVMLGTQPRIKALDERPTVEHLVSEVMGAVMGKAGRIADLDKTAIKTMQKSYFEEAEKYTEIRGKQMLVDKMPLTERFIHILYRIFPNAKFVFMLRHPCDVLLSCYMQNFVHNQITLATLDLETAAKQYAAAMDLFTLVREKLPADIHIVRYENLVTEPEKTGRALFEFLGLPWRPSALDFHKTEKNGSEVVSASYRQVTEPLYQKSAGRWRNYYDHLEPVFDIITPAARRYEYALEETT